MMKMMTGAILALCAAAVQAAPLRVDATEVLPFDVQSMAASPLISAETIAVNVEHQVTLGSAGKWTDTAGWSTWSYAVSVPGAFSLGFHAAAVLPESAKIVLVGADGASLKTYAARDLTEADGNLWSVLVPGDTLALEVRVPTSDRAGTSLAIDQISVGTKASPLQAKMADAVTEATAQTQENWSCEASSSNTNAANATFMYTVQTTSPESGGTQSVMNQCTATLVNDVQKDGRLFAMTAAHCAGVATGLVPSSLVAYWGAVSPCSAGLQTAQSVAAATSNGATSRALFNTTNGANTGDSWLLELTGQGVPANSNAYFAGWDATNRFVSGEPSNVFNINHSSGESRQYAATSGGTDSSGTVSPFILYDWQVGETLAGASGSGAFNQNEAVFGTLTSTVNTSTGNAGQFFALSSAWKGSNQADSSSDSFQPWLDPSNTGTLVIGGQAPPAVAPTVSISVSPNSVTAGTSYTVTWSSANAASCTASGAWSGTEATSGKLTTSQESAGTYNYVLNCTGTGGSAGNSAAVVVTSTGGSSSSSSGGSSSSSSGSGSSGGGGGGGAFGPWSLVGLIFIRSIRRRRIAS